MLDATGKWLIPGAIDDQVHFREPGVTHKGNIASEVVRLWPEGLLPLWICQIPIRRLPHWLIWNGKLQRGAETSAANYSFFSVEQMIIWMRSESGPD